MKIVVVGDTLLDVDLRGTADRLSPDAPVPVVDVQDALRRPGGAGLVALLLAHDGADVTLVTVLSDDERSSGLRAALEGVPVIAGASNGPTPVKTRVRAGTQAVVRVDEGCAPPAAPGTTPEMLAAIRAADAVLVADYGRGVAADPEVRAALDHRRAGAPLVWDPHPRGSAPVRSATVVTPNLAEALSISGESAAGVVGASRAAAALRERWGCEAVVVTLGSHGALLDRASAPLVVPAPSIAAADTCGAGDRLAATLVTGLAGGASLPDAVASAVASASAFLAGGGVGALPVLARVPGAQPGDDPSGAAPPGVGTPSDEPVHIGGSAAAALDVARRTRAAGGTVVATGGCFDLLHAGHARTLAAARALGDCLVVCLNSDASVRRLKGDERPIIGQEDRVDLLLALECVDAVLVFDEDSPHDALDRLRPDVWVKGGDYTLDALPEAQLVRSWGGCTVTVPYHPARSTSLLARALARVS